MDQLTGSSAAGVIRLQGVKNWSLWKFQMTVLMKAMGVYSVVSGAEKKSDKEDWIKRDCKAQSLIVTRLTESAMVHILTCETAGEMWSKLLTVYEQKSSTSLHMLQQRFFNLKYNGHSDMATFLAEIQELASRLKQAGEEVSEKFIITKVLMSIPDKYNHLVTAWESVEASRQNYDDLVARLLVEEERSKARNEDGDSENVAMFHSKRWVSGRPGTSGSKCFKCGRSGHFSKDCRNDNENRKCFLCNKVGHIKPNCPTRYNNNNNMKKGNAFVSMTIDSMNKSSLSNKWVVDSGASEHMTFNRNLFTSFCQVSDRFVIVGDGRQLPVLGIGDIEFVDNKLTNVLFVPELRLNLFSVLSATAKGYTVELTKDKCNIKKGDVLCVSGGKEGNFYALNFNADAQCMVVTLSEWHERLGHQNIEKEKTVHVKRDVLFVMADTEKLNTESDDEKVVYLDWNAAEEQEQEQEVVEPEPEKEVVEQEQEVVEEEQEVVEQEQREEQQETPETENDNSEVLDETEEPERSRSSRIVKKPIWMSHYFGFIASEEPVNYKEAMEREDADIWKKAADKEIEQLNEKKTWSLEEKVPEGQEIISTKWISRLKKGQKGEKVYKARLVARGFHLYAPVVKLNIFRIFMAVATKFKEKTFDILTKPLGDVKSRLFKTLGIK